MSHAPDKEKKFTSHNKSFWRAYEAQCDAEKQKDDQLEKQN